MSLRTILIVIGVLIFVAILVDGFRHWRRAKQHEKEMDRRGERPMQDVEPQLNKKIDFGHQADFEPKLKSHLDDANDDFIEDVRFIKKDIEPQFREPEHKFSAVEPKFKDPEPTFTAVEPKLTQTVKSTFSTPKPAPVTKPAPARMPEPLPKKDKFIILHVLAEADTYFSGEALVTKFADHKLHFGPMDIYHYYEHDGYGDILFSVANAFEPGNLILDYPQGFYTQGLTFFIQLPGQGDTEEAFESMLNTATLLAKSLNARICDHHRQPLTPVRVEQYRQEVNACNII
ncbi:MAG: cell division protein ZipA [Gammaproteobacteria bacterium]|jgi:cell division protein ZipA